jgi:hypothetical protein
MRITETEQRLAWEAETEYFIMKNAKKRERRRGGGGRRQGKIPALSTFFRPASWRKSEGKN